MAESVFIGPFRSEMQDFIFLKRSVGYKYNSEPGILSRFDRYLAVNYPQADALSKEAVTGWCSKRCTKQLQTTVPVHLSYDSFQST